MLIRGSIGLAAGRNSTSIDIATNQVVDCLVLLVAGRSGKLSLPNALIASKQDKSGQIKVPKYEPSEIEPRWQRYWDENKTFKTPESVGEKKLYALDMFPYPSGNGLHVGHPEGYTATDIMSASRKDE